MDINKAKEKATLLRSLGFSPENVAGRAPASLRAISRTVDPLSSPITEATSDGDAGPKGGGNINVYQHFGDDRVAGPAPMFSGTGDAENFLGMDTEGYLARLKQFGIVAKEAGSGINSARWHEDANGKLIGNVQRARMPDDEQFWTGAMLAASIVSGGAASAAGGTAAGGAALAGGITGFGNTYVETGSAKKAIRGALASAAAAYAGGQAASATSGLGAAASQAIGGATSGATGTLLNGGSGKDALKGAVMGAIPGAVSGLTGSSAGTPLNSTLVTLVRSAVKGQKPEVAQLLAQYLISQSRQQQPAAKPGG